MAKAGNRARATEGLSIACKLPSGLHIKHESLGIDLKLHGSHSPYAVAGHGITRGVPVDTWNAIKTLHADAAWLQNEVVFATTDPESAADKAEEREEARAGFEPIDPEKLPRGIENPGAE